MMSRLLVTGASLALLAGCGTATPPPSPAPSPSTKTVADYFSPPRAYPGPTWTKDGRSVGSEELNTIAGPDHCDWQSAVMMHLGWPLGTVSKTADDSRQFIRDPDGVIDTKLRDKLGTGVALPADAKDTSYRHGELELWLSPSEPDAAYLRVGESVEHWPRADPLVACA